MKYLLVLEKGKLEISEVKLILERAEKLSDEELQAASNRIREILNNQEQKPEIQ